MAIELNALDVSTFQNAYEALAQYKSGGRQRVKGPNFGVAVAVLMARRKGYGPHWPIQISEVGQGPGVTTGQLQGEICNRAWSKLPAFLPAGAQGPIYKPFEISFKPAAANDWRHSFDLQSGLGCDAPPTADFLLNEQYLGEDRFYCPFRNLATAHCSSPAGNHTANRTCFKPGNKPGPPPQPTTTALRCPKLLARGKENGEAAYWHTAPNAEVLGQLVGDPNARVPIYPFMAALYSGSDALIGSEPKVTLERFQREIALTDQALAIVFDADPNSQHNRDFLNSIGGAVHPQAPPPAAPAANPAVNLSVQPKPFQFGRPLSQFRRAARERADPAQRLAALEKANRGHAMTLERAATIFQNAGYTLQEDVSSFDLLCAKGTANYLIEVKTWTNSNIRNQIRGAISQLAEYEWKLRARAIQSPKKLIVLDRKPPPFMIPYLRDFVEGFLGISTCWTEGAKLCTVRSAALKI